MHKRPATAPQRSPFPDAARILAASDQIQGLAHGAGRQTIDGVHHDAIAALTDAGVEVLRLSVGQGLWMEDEERQSEKDFDLIVRGTQRACTWVAAKIGLSGTTDGRQQGQVFVAIPNEAGETATVAVPVQATTAGWDAGLSLALRSLPTGWHVAYRPDGTVAEIFIAGIEQDPAWFTGLVLRVLGILKWHGAQFGVLDQRDATVVSLRRGQYEAIIAAGPTAHPQ